MSTYHRQQLQAAGTRLVIDRSVGASRFGGSDVLFRARDQAGNEVALVLGLSAWGTLRAETGSDPVAELEQLALSGGWEQAGAGRVWRVVLI